MSSWKTIDLDHVLDVGDNLLEYLGIDRNLDVSDLPNQIFLEGFGGSITKLSLHDGETTIGSGQFLLSTFQNRQSALLFMNGTVTGSIELSRTFYLFGSRSRNRQGLTNSDGSSVFLNFSILEHVQIYIQVIHLEYVFLIF